MTDPATASCAGLTGPPWTAPDTVYFYGGPLSNFAPTPGLRLPYGYLGHQETERVPVATVEHWFQACKATSRRDFDNILSCASARHAKHAGGQVILRPDWETVKFDVMVCALRSKFRQLEPYRSLLLLTHPRRLAEDSPTDFEWGCRDEDGGYGGGNLLGLALMRVRRELEADVLRRVSALSSAR